MPDGQHCVEPVTFESVPRQPQSAVALLQPCVPGVGPFAAVAAGVELLHVEVVHLSAVVSQLGLVVGQQCPLDKLGFAVEQHCVVLPAPSVSVPEQPHLLFVASQPTVPATKVVLLAATAAGVLGHVAHAPVLVSHR